MIILLFVNIQFSMFLRSLCEVKRLKTIPSQRSLALEFILHQCHGTNPPEAAGSWLPTSAVAKAIAKQWPRWQPGWPAHPAKCHERLETNTTENHHTKNSGRFQNIYQTQFHPISGVSMLKLQIFRSFFFGRFNFSTFVLLSCWCFQSIEGEKNIPIGLWTNRPNIPPSLMATVKLSAEAWISVDLVVSCTLWMVIVLSNTFP